MRAILAVWCVVLGACGGGGGGGGGAPPGQGAASLEADPLDFGTVAVGLTAEREIVLRNPGAEPVQVLGLSIPQQPFAFAGAAPALPAVVPGGQALRIRLAFTPLFETRFLEDLTVLYDAGAQLEVLVEGRGLVAEATTDFGSVPIDPGTEETGELAVDVPPDAISFTIEAFGGTETAPAGGALFLASLVGPGGAVYVDAADPHAGPYVFERNWPAGGIFSPVSLPWTPRDHARFQVPNTDRIDAQLVPGGGTYRFRISNQRGTLANVTVRVHVERRPGGSAREGRIPLNVFLAAGLPLTPLNAGTDRRLQDALGEADRVLRQTGAGLGRISYFKLADPRFDRIDFNELEALFRESAAAPERRVNVFLVNASSSFVAGQAGALPGGKTNGGPFSGVYVVYDPFRTATDLGLVIAHEIGHNLGLNHTRELPGNAPYTHDLIDDTAVCPGPDCTIPPANNYLMDSIAPVAAQAVITPGQAHVLLRNVLVEPGAPTFARLAQRGPRVVTLGPAAAWCGVCAGH